jgi:hypothetical protein
MHTHRTDPISLVAGTIFLVIGIVATVGSLTWADLRGEWLGPVLLGAAGIALLATVPFRSSVSTEAFDPASQALGDGDDTTDHGADQAAE